MTSRHRDIDPAGAAIMLLALGIAVALPAALIIAALPPASASDPEIIAVVATLAAAALGAVTGYLTRSRQHPPDEPDSHPPEAGGVPAGDDPLRTIPPQRTS